MYFGNLKANKAIECFQWELLECQQDVIKVQTKEPLGTNIQIHSVKETLCHCWDLKINIPAVTETMECQACLLGLSEQKATGKLFYILHCNSKKEKQYNCQEIIATSGNN